MPDANGHFKGISVPELPWQIVESEDCPKDTAYVVDPRAASTLAQHHDVAQAIAEGKTPVVAPSKEIGEKVREAMNRVGRIDL